MIYQMMNGQRVNTVRVTGSATDIAKLATILEGQSEIYELKAEGGTTAHVAEFNSFSFSVGKKYASGARRSAMVRIPHLKPSKTYSDVSAEVKGKWDASFVTADACTYCNGMGATSKGGIA